MTPVWICVLKRLWRDVEKHGREMKEARKIKRRDEEVRRYDSLSMYVLCLALFHKLSRIAICRVQQP